MQELYQAQEVDSINCRHLAKQHSKVISGKADYHKVGQHCIAELQNADELHRLCRSYRMIIFHVATKFTRVFIIISY